MALHASINLGHENEYSNLFNDHVVIKIVRNIPINELPKLELVSKQFRRCVQSVYCALKIMDLKTMFLPEFGKYLKMGNEKVFDQFFTKLIHHSPLLETILGFDCLVKEISSHHLDLLSELTELKNITFESVPVHISGLFRFSKKCPRMKSLKMNSFRSEHVDEENDAQFDFLQNFGGLTELVLNILPECSGSFLSTINPENLTVLDLMGNSFKVHHIGAFLSRCNNLETLKLTDLGTCSKCSTNGYESEVLQCLPNLPKLRVLVLHLFHHFGEVDAGHVITYNADHLLNIIIKCKSLREIYLRNNFQLEIFTDDFLLRLIEGCPNLESLNYYLKHCRSEEIVSKIEHLRNLKHLILHFSDNDSFKVLCSKLHKLNNLTRLELWDASEEELVLLKGLKNLMDFTCRGSVTETVVAKWIENGFLKNLTVLNISTYITESVVKSICENTPILKKLDFFGEEFTDESLVVIAECCKYLQVLDIDFSSTITERGLLNLLLNCPSLRRVKVASAFYDVVLSNVLFQPFKHVVVCPFSIYDYDFDS